MNGSLLDLFSSDKHGWCDEKHNKQCDRHHRLSLVPQAFTPVGV